MKPGSAKAISILEEADGLTSTDHQQTYGHPSRNLDRIAALWSVLLETIITPRQVGMCMIALKMARDMHTPKRDNLVDIAGYARVIEMLNDAS